MRLANQTGPDCASTTIFAPRAATASIAPAIASRGWTATQSGSQRRTSGVALRRSVNSVTAPGASTRANPRLTGVSGMSPPRMLSSQAIEAGSDSTAASRPASARAAAVSAIFSSEALPACSRGWIRMGESGAAGRFDHTASTGLASQAASAPPAFPTAAASFSRSGAV